MAAAGTGRRVTSTALAPLCALLDALPPLPASPNG